MNSERFIEFTLYLEANKRDSNGKVVFNESFNFEAGIVFRVLTHTLSRPAASIFEFHSDQRRIEILWLPGMFV